jgi:hypothetical protein
MEWIKEKEFLVKGRLIEIRCTIFYNRSKEGWGSDFFHKKFPKIMIQQPFVSMLNTHKSKLFMLDIDFSSINASHLNLLSCFLKVICSKTLSIFEWSSFCIHPTKIPCSPFSVINSMVSLSELELSFIKLIYCVLKTSN